MDRKSQQNNIDFEIRFFEGILGENSNFIELLAALGDLYTKKGWYKKGLKIDQKLSNLRPDDPTILYNLACSYSLVDNIDNALKTIKKAVQCGYSDFKHLQKDHDLENLKKDQRFKRYLSRLIKK